MLRFVIPNAHRQHGYGVRLEWGEEGVRTLGADCGVLIVVDVLSFSTTVDIATARGAGVLPLPADDERAERAARQAGAVLAGDREWTLRPSSVLDIPADVLLGLASPNGGTLCAIASATGCVVLTGCLRNATAVAKEAARIAAGRAIGVIAAGERWQDVRGPLRPCVADQLGAGAVVAELRQRDAGVASPEARLAEAAYLAVAGSGLADAVAGCASGRELVDRGDGEDVHLAAMADTSTTVPLLVDGVFREAR
jgi:2-phosphosulfolactate phosphatase